MNNLQDIVEKNTGKGVVVQFHKEGLKFTGDDYSIQNLMFQMIGAVAQFERLFLKERQMEGIRNALNNGVRFGAQKKLSEEQVKEI